MHRVPYAGRRESGTAATGTSSGGKAARAPKFPYSDALKKAQITWDNSTLDRWLADPDALVPDNDMSFRLENADERAAILFYLRQLASGRGESRWTWRIVLASGVLVFALAGRSAPVRARVDRSGTSSIAERSCASCHSDRARVYQWSKRERAWLRALATNQ